MKHSDGPLAGTGSETPAYRERLWPGPAVWLLVLGIAAALGIAYGAALGAAIGWMAAVIVAALGVLMILRMAVVIEVRADGLAADRALLPWSAIGEVLALDRPGVQLATGPAGDHTAFLVLRPGAGPGAVVVEVVDTADPHRTWLVGSRHPEMLARAIAAARDRLRA